MKIGGAHGDAAFQLPVLWLCHLVHIYIFHLKEKGLRLAAELTSNMF